MDIGRTLVGGYRRSEVDRRIGSLAERLGDAEEKAAALEAELAGLRKSSRADIEAAEREAEAGRRRIGELKAQADALAKQAEELKEQLAARDRQIFQMEERCRQADRTAELYDEKVRQIGRIYLDAFDYSERLKENAKKEVADIVNSFFNEALSSGKSARNARSEMDGYKGTLGDIAAGLEETSAFLKRKLEGLGYREGRSLYPQEGFDSAKVRIIDKVRDGFGQDDARGADRAAGSRESMRTAAAYREAPEPMPREEVPAAGDAEEDRQKYRQKYDELDRARHAGDGRTAGGTEEGADMSADGDARGEDISDMPAASPRKTSIREILEKYSKY